MAMLMMVTMLTMQSMVLASNVIMTYQGSLFLVKTGCPKTPAYIFDKNLITSSRQRRDYNDCMKDLRGRKVTTFSLD